MINFGQKKLLFFGILILVLLYCIYQYISDQKIVKNGVYTKATVVNAESKKGGMVVTIEYYYGGNKYDMTLGSELGTGSIGRQYFVQILPKSPKSFFFH